MTKKSIKKWLLGAAGLVLVLASVLVVHIYMVTKRTAPDAQTVAMARVDFPQQINNDDATKITQWLYQQQGVDHVLCNTEGHLVVFTYRPLQTNADKIVNKMKQELPYQSARFMPDETQMADGCPVAKTSVTYKLYNFFK